MRKTTSNGAKKSHAVTMADVAREVGVTKMAVSFALNGTGRVSQETRQIVVEAAHRLGFEPNPHAQNLSNGRSHNTIGLFTLWFDFGVGTQKIQLIQSLLNQQGFDVPIYGIGLHDSSSADVQTAAIASIRRQKPRALVCFTQRLHPKALLELRRYQEEGGILVSYDYPVDLDCDAVLFDREDNTYQAVRHLMELGHRRIGYGDHGFAPADSSRVRGFKRAVEEFGGEWREEWQIEGRNSRNYAEGGNTLAAQYLKLQECPSALCIINDYAALVFMAQLERAGLRCPQEVSVVGHDDHALSRYFPVPLTSVSHPSEAIAHHVAQLLLSRLSGEYDGPSRHITVRGELIPRLSTAPPQMLLPSGAPINCLECSPGVPETIQHTVEETSRRKKMTIHHSNPVKPATSTKRGFTLIELLVVIAIIAILAAILFPVFGRARENARRSSCQSNLKQIALGIKQYTQDYDERFPNQVHVGGSAANPPVGWADTIQPYIKSLQLYQCPSDKTPPGATPSFRGYTDYFINAALGNTGTASSPQYSNGGISESVVENSSLTILAADTTTRTADETAPSDASTARFRCNGNAIRGTTGSGAELTQPSYGTAGVSLTNGVYPKHLGGANIAFVDGHVKWQKINNSTGTTAGNNRGQIFNAATPFVPTNGVTTVSGNSPTFATSSEAATS